MSEITFTTAPAPERAQREDKFWPIVEQIAAVPGDLMALFDFDTEKDAHNFVAGLQRSSQGSSVSVRTRAVYVGKKNIDSNTPTGWTMDGDKYAYTGPQTRVGVAVVARKEKSDDASAETAPAAE